MHKYWTKKKIATWYPAIDSIICVLIFLRIQYSTVQYSTVQYSTVQYSTVQYSTVQYSTVQYSTVQYSTVQLPNRVSVRPCNLSAWMCTWMIASVRIWSHLPLGVRRAACARGRCDHAHLLCTRMRSRTRRRVVPGACRWRRRLRLHALLRLHFSGR